MRNFELKRSAKKKNRNNDPLRRYNYMAIFKINCFNKKMVVKNRSSNSNSNSDLSLADKYIQEAEEEERSQRFSKLDDNDEMEGCKQDEDDVPKWVNEPIRFPPTLTTDSFDNHELLESPNLRLRKPVQIKRTATAETEAESNCDFKDHSKCKRKPIGKQLVVLTKMLIFYLVYLCIGALAFSHMESDAETKRCNKAVTNVASSKNDFTTKYFYIFGLNLKFCRAIDEFVEARSDEYLDANQKMMSFFFTWRASNCSREMEKPIWEAVQAEPKELIDQYVTTWRNISQLKLAENFDHEILIVSGRTMRRVIQRTAQFGINNFLALKTDCTDNWNFHNSFFFAGTVATTIGYGSITPKTEEGKAFCIVFTMIGIPFFAFMVNRISDLIMESLKFLKRTLNFGKFVLHLTYIGVGFVALIFIPARIFMKIEGWSALEAVYFIIVSLTTIGFGDYSPRMDPPKEQAYSKHNETACLFELINPIPSRNVNVETGLTTSCDKDKWSDSLQKSYNIYRVAVFLWILIGLSWIGGVVNIITNFFQTGMNDMKAPKLHLKRTFISDCFVKNCIPANYKHLCSKEQLKWTTYPTPAPNSPGAPRKRNTKTMLMVDYDGTDISYHSCTN